MYVHACVYVCVCVCVCVHVIITNIYISRFKVPFFTAARSIYDYLTSFKIAPYIH